MGPIYPTTNCDPTIPEGLNTHLCQGSGAAKNLPQEEHVRGSIYPITNCGPIVTDRDDLNTHYCQDLGIPLHGQQTFSPWTQNPQGLMDFSYPTELTSMNFNLYQDSSGASTSAQPNFGPHHHSQW